VTTGDLTVVTGAGGFIGGHLVADLLGDGQAVRAVDVKPVDQWHQRFDDAEVVVADLRDEGACFEAVEGASAVYNLAADMGGMGFIENNRALCMLSVLINTHLLQASSHHGVERYFFSSSACVYAAERQRSPEVVALREDDAYPAEPEDGYGWEKLFSERMCRHFREDFGLETRVARYHNVYGPHGTWSGGREKAPAAICRKVIVATLSGSNRIDLWPEPWPRSFLYVTDAVRGAQAVLESKVTDPVDLAGAEAVTIDRLLDIVEAIAGVRLERSYEKNRRSCRPSVRVNLPRLRRQLGWEPEIPLRAGLEHTYRWIQDQMASGTGSAGLARRIS
jgi:nucleoside-diphosphate-sugar epimerase